jgi:beta-glucosidase
MRALGTDAYRFSIAWPRVFPQGAGAPNAKGLDFYERLVDALLAAGIRPFATLYHWDLRRRCRRAAAGRRAAPRSPSPTTPATWPRACPTGVRDFITVNEMRTFVDLGYGGTVHAPGLALPPARTNQARHHVLLGHGLAVQAIGPRRAPAQGSAWPRTCWPRCPRCGPRAPARPRSGPLAR